MSGRQRLLLCEMCLGILLASLALVCSSAISRFSPIPLSGLAPLVVAASLAGTVLVSQTDQMLSLISAVAVTCLISSAVYLVVLLLLFCAAGYWSRLDTLSLQVLQRLIVNAMAICIAAVFSASISHVLSQRLR